MKNAAPYPQFWFATIIEKIHGYKTIFGNILKASQYNIDLYQNTVRGHNHIRH